MAKVPFKTKFSYRTDLPLLLAGAGMMAPAVTTPIKSKFRAMAASRYAELEDVDKSKKLIRTSRKRYPFLKDVRVRLEDNARSARMGPSFEIADKEIIGPTTKSRLKYPYVSATLDNPSALAHEFGHAIDSVHKPKRNKLENILSSVSDSISKGLGLGGLPEVQTITSNIPVFNRFRQDKRANKNAEKLLSDIYGPSDVKKQMEPNKYLHRGNVIGAAGRVAQALGTVAFIKGLLRLGRANKRAAAAAAAARVL